MNYEIVSLEEKTIVGFSARTNNASPEMGEVIGGLWRKLYSENGCALLDGRVNGKAVGVYTDYDNNHTGDYTVIAACEVSQAQNIPEHMTVRKIPAGKYAKFVVKGNMLTAVSDFWRKLWDMDLNRTFVCDFEEYQNADFDNAEIHIYISVNEVG